MKKTIKKLLTLPEVTRVHIYYRKKDEKETGPYSLILDFVWGTSGHGITDCDVSASKKSCDVTITCGSGGIKETHYRAIDYGEEGSKCISFNVTVTDTKGALISTIYSGTSFTSKDAEIE